MTTLQILTLIIGMLSSTSLIVAALSTHKPRYLTFALITSALLLFQFGLAGAFIGVGISAVSLIRNGLILASLKNPTRFAWGNHWVMIPISMAAYAGAWTIFNNFETFDPLTLFPLVGALIQTLAVWFSNMIYTKSLLIVSGSGWLVYEYVSGTYGHMIGESANIVANIVALVFLVKAARTNTPVLEPVTEAVKVITTAIPIIKDHTASITRPIILPTSDLRPSTGTVDLP